MTNIATNFANNNIETNIGSKINKILRTVGKTSFIALGPSFSYWLYEVVKQNEKQDGIIDMVFVTGSIDIAKITGELYLLDKILPYYNQYVIPVFEVLKNYIN